MPKITLPSGNSYFICEELADIIKFKEEIIDTMETTYFMRGLLAAAKYIQQHPCTCTHIDLVAGILELKDEQ
jgi:hypothetical protein